MKARDDKRDEEPFSNIRQEDVNAFVGSLRRQGTPWADGCAALIVALWGEVEASRYEEIEHEHFGCHVAKTGIYAPSHALENDGSDRRRRNIGHKPERRVTNGSARDASVASTTPQKPGETPRTDAWEKDFNFSTDGIGFMSYADAYHAALKHARQLERELRQSIEDGARIVDDNDGLRRDLASAASATPCSVTDAMVDRFLSWKLPEDFHPDAGISFSPYFNVEYNAKHGKPPERHKPIGTNLLTATQARAMLEHVLRRPDGTGEKNGS